MSTFEYVEAGLDDSRWRISLRKSKVPQFDFKEEQKKRELALDTQKHDLISYKGVSLSFLNEFWRNVRHEHIFKGLELLQLKKTIKGVPKGTTVSKVETNALSDGTLEIKCKDARTGKIITVSSTDVKRKGRKMWTIQDVSQFAIMPQTTLTHAPYANSIDSNKLGDNFHGWFILCSQDTVFEELLLSLREYIKDVGRAPAEMSFFWIDLFCMNKSLLKEANRSSQSEKLKIFKDYDFSYNETLRLFDTRFIYLTNWVKPNIFFDLTCVWNMCRIFENKFPFEVLPDKKIASKFATIYDTDDNTLFDSIDNLDPSKLRPEAPFLSRFMIEQLVSKPEGFASVRNLFEKSFAKWAKVEVEEEIKKVPDSRDRKGMEHFAKFLYKTGNFFRKHKELLIAKSYFKRALENYNDLQLHYQEDFDARAEFDEVTMSEQLDVDRVNGGASKVHLYQGLIFLSEKQLEKARLEFKRAEKEATKIATQKANFLYDVSEARVKLYLLTNEVKYAMKELESMSLLLRDDRKRSSRLKYADVKYHEATLYNLKKDYGKAKQFLQEGINVIVEEIGENSLQAGKFYTELAKVFFRNKEKDSSLEYFDKAYTIYTRVKGSINEEVAHILHKIGHVYGSIGTEEAYKDSLNHIRRSIEAYSQSTGTYSLNVVELQTNEAFLLRRMKDFDEAEKVCMNALKTLDEETSLKEKMRIELSIKDMKKRDNMRALIYSTWGQIQEETYQYFKAKKSYQKAYEITKATHGEDAQQTKRRKERWDKSEETARIAMTIKNTT